MADDEFERAWQAGLDSDSWECSDAEGFGYPEHDYHHNECVRCGAVAED